MRFYYIGLAVVAYLFVAGATMEYKRVEDPDCDLSRPNEISFRNGTSGAMTGMIWPIYWPIRFGEISAGSKSACLAKKPS